MPGLEELHKQLASLREEAAAFLNEGATPLQVLQLRRECVRLWAAIAAREARPKGA